MSVLKPVLNQYVTCGNEHRCSRLVDLGDCCVGTLHNYCCASRIKTGNLVVAIALLIERKRPRILRASFLTQIHLTEENSSAFRPGTTASICPFRDHDATFQRHRYPERLYRKTAIQKCRLLQRNWKPWARPIDFLE